MTNFSHGRVAENQATVYLKNRGYKILEQNWKTRFCEIDIVAQKDRCVYFIEVKYRLSDQQGTGLEYIMTRKLNKMGFAAEMWVQSYRWEGDYSLGAVEVSGADYKVTNFLPELV